MSPPTTKSPLWAKFAPVLYLATCAAALKAISIDPSADVGVPGIDQNRA